MERILRWTYKYSSQPAELVADQGGDETGSRNLRMHVG